MAVDTTKYKRLRNKGIAHDAAIELADSARTPAQGSTVAAPSALTAPTTMAGTYTQSEVQALRTDVANLRTTVANLLTSLKNGGSVAGP